MKKLAFPQIGSQDMSQWLKILQWGVLFIYFFKLTTHCVTKNVGFKANLWAGVEAFILKKQQTIFISKSAASYINIFQ